MLENHPKSKFTIWCYNFKEGEEIPEIHGHGSKGNKIPKLSIGPPPHGTKTIALIMDDPDARAVTPDGKVWDHWLFYDIITTPKQDRVEGKNSWGEIGYGGPEPPDKEHTYIFRAYALDEELDLKEGYSKQELKDAISKVRILAKAELTGTYAP
tara:strand:- start:53 stop:514 length:462 start_codon:yes stop_codon:yes gene_type:complete